MYHKFTHEHLYAQNDTTPKTKYKNVDIKNTCTCR